MHEVATMTKAIEDEIDTEDALDTRIRPMLRVTNGALDNEPDSPSGVVLNGRLDAATLRFLRVDHTYQRPLGERPDIFDALMAGKVVPNIEVGVRGQDFEIENGAFLIYSSAFIIDGWQRVGTALRILEMKPDHPIRMFATCHFGSDEVWERHRFVELNRNIRKVSPNLHLRNMRDQNDAVLTLYGLSNNTREFTLFHKVSWAQNMRRGEILPALTMAKVCCRLHTHLGPVYSGGVDKVADTLLRVARAAGLNNFRRNVTTFFEVVEDCWGLHNIELRHAAPQIKAQFLFQLAKVFSFHTDFWDEDGRLLFVSADSRRKLAKFPLNDPHVRNLAGSPGAAGNILYDMLVKHINSGRRTGRLEERE